MRGHEWVDERGGGEGVEGGRGNCGVSSGPTTASRVPPFYLVSSRARPRFRRKKRRRRRRRTLSTERKRWRRPVCGMSRFHTISLPLPPPPPPPLMRPRRWNLWRKIYIRKVNTGGSFCVHYIWHASPRLSSGLRLPSSSSSPVTLTLPIRRPRPLSRRVIL